MSKLIFTFGRFNPPTIGHSKLFKYMTDMAYYQDADCFVGVSKTQSKTKNPLDIDTKMKYLTLLFPEMSFVRATIECPDFIGFLKKYDNMYDEVIFICGQDRIAEYQRLVDTYNGKEFTFKSIKVISAGNRTTSGHGVCGSSSTILRKYATNDDFKSFWSMIPTDNIEYAFALFYEVRHGLGLKSQEFSFYK